MERVRFLTQYLRARQAEGSAPDTLRHHHRSLVRFDGWMERYDLSDATATLLHLTDFIYELKEKYPPDHVNQYVSALRVYFRWLTEVDTRADNPAAKLKILPAEPKPVDSLTLAEVKALLSYAHASKSARFGTYRGAILILVLIDTGMRIGEAMRLRLEDLNLVESRIAVTASKTKTQRVVPISPAVRRHIREYLKRRNDHLRTHGIYDPHYVFISEQGIFWLRNTAERCLKNVAREAGLSREFHSHLCRHAFATLSLMNKAPLPAVMAIGGWKKLSTVQRYTTMTVQQLQEVHAQTSPITKASEVSWVLPAA